MPRIYRLLSDDDTSAFCHKVSAALAKGWDLHGAASIAFDPVRGVMRCAQAITKQIDAEYHPDMKLGQQ